MVSVQVVNWQGLIQDTGVQLEAERGKLLDLQQKVDKTARVYRSEQDCKVGILTGFTANYVRAENAYNEAVSEYEKQLETCSGLREDISMMRRELEVMGGEEESICEKIYKFMHECYNCVFGCFRDNPNDVCWWR